MRLGAHRFTYETSLERGDREINVTIGVAVYPGCSAYVEIESVRDEAGDYVQITDGELEDMTEDAGWHHTKIMEQHNDR